MDHVSYVDFAALRLESCVSKTPLGKGEISTSWMSQAGASDVQGSLGSQGAEKGHWGWPWVT